MFHALDIKYICISSHNIRVNKILNHFTMLFWKRTIINVVHFLTYYNLIPNSQHLNIRFQKFFLVGDWNWKISHLAFWLIRRYLNAWHFSIQTQMLFKIRIIWQLVTLLLFEYRISMKFRWSLYLANSSHLWHSDSDAFQNQDH